MKINKVLLSFLTALVFLLTLSIAELPKYRAFNDGLMRIYFLNVGQGDSTLIKLPSKKLILIDAGPNSSIGEIISESIPFNINKIDLVVVSHSHADHITGLINVLENYEVGCMVYDMQDEANSETERYLREQINARNINVISTTDAASDKTIPKSCFTDNDVQLSIYSLLNINELNDTAAKNNQNLESNILLLKYKEFEALFTADAEIDVQSKTLHLLNSNIEVLKVPHQGSFDAFYPPLIQKLQPDLAVFSVGEGNSYGHPHTEVLSGYEDLGLKYARTDRNGTVIVKTDGLKWGNTSENTTQL